MSSTLIFTKHEGAAITDEQIKNAALLFSSNYGVWGPMAESKIGPFAKQGRQIRMSARHLKNELLPPSPARNFYIQVRDGDELAGNVFATRWCCDGRKVCWITQLCVGSKYRHQGVATKLLSKLREGEADDAFGVLSSNPFTVMAAIRAFGDGNFDLSTTRNYAKAILASSPVKYVRTAQLHGLLFGEKVEDGAVCCADTRFYIDHTEPDKALKAVRSKGVPWPLGELPHGHEFLVIINETRDIGLP